MSTPASTVDVDGRRRPLTAHLDELRRRLWVCLAAVSVAAAVTFGWAGTLIDWLKRPAGSRLPTLAFFSPPEAFLAHMQVALTSGLILSLPLILYEVWVFVSPGLTAQERRYGLAFVWWGTLLFLAGAAFAYWLLLPLSLQFLLGFGAGQLTPVISIGKYLSFTTAVLLACGVVFELPLAVLLLAKIGVVHPEKLRAQWRTAVVVIMVVAAIVTPTADVATMMLIAVPMLFLYELSIWVAGWVVPRPRSDG